MRGSERQSVGCVHPQPGSGDAGHECLLFHDTQDALTCDRVHVRLLVQYSRDGGRGDPGESSDVTYRDFLCHSYPLWLVILATMCVTTQASCWHSCVTVVGTGYATGKN